MAEQRQIAGVDGAEPDDVLARFTEDDVVAEAAVDEIVAGTASQGVVAASAAQPILAGSAQQRVIAGGAIQKVVAPRSVEGVVQDVAGNVVVEGIAGAFCAADQGQDLDIGSERIAYERLDLVLALVRQLRDLVSGVEDEIDVVALAAHHQVDARAALERIRAVTAIQLVIAIVADQLVEAGAAVHDIVADPAGQAIAAASASQGIVAVVAVDDGITDASHGDDVRLAVSGRVDGRGRRQDQRLDLLILLDPEADGAVDGVFATAGLVHDEIAEVVDEVDVVAEAANQGVGITVTVERVVALVAGQRVLAAVANDDVVERVAGAVDIGEALQISDFPRPRQA